MSKECCDLTLRVVLGTTLPKLRIRLESIKKGAACVEVFPGAARIRLITNSIEEIRSHNICDRNTTPTTTSTARRWIARTGLAAGAAVVIAGAAVPILAAAQASVTAAVLSQHGPQKGSGEDSDDKDCYQLCNHVWRRKRMKPWWGFYRVILLMSTSRQNLRKLTAFKFTFEYVIGWGN